MTFFFNFISSDYGIKQIDEPFGFDATPFGIKQDEGRKGRDVVYAGNGEAKFTITREVDIYGFHFEKFLRDWKRYGFELRIEFMCDFGNGIEVVGDVADVEYNGFDSISFIVRQKLQEAKFKLNYETETNQFSDIDVEGSLINKATPIKFLLKAKPIRQISEWDNPTIGRQMLFDNPVVNADYFNVIKNQLQYEIADSLSWLQDTNDSLGGAFVNFNYIRFETNAVDVKVEINLNIVYDYLPQYNNSLTEGKNGQILLRLYYGQGNGAGQYTQVNVWNSQVFQGTSNGQQVLDNVNFTVDIPSVNATDYLWISFVSATGNGAVNRITFNKSSVKISVKSISLNTVFKTFRYIDAIKYTVKSASGLDVYAPRYDFGGELYDTFITIPSLMRGLTDKPFNMSCKEFIEEHIRPEQNGDYEITPDARLFLGFYRDFYRDFEIASFEQDVLEGYNAEAGERKKIKRINNGFKYYASQKENETENTYDIVHAEEQQITPNQLVTNDREAMVGFIRDAYMLAITQRKAYETSRTSATQDDDKKYLIDGVRTTTGINFTETLLLQHLYDPTTQQLILRNTTENNWSLLDIGIGSTFQIINTANAGSYVVNSVTDTELFLASTGANNITGENTRFKYFISEDVMWMNRTNEGFLTIQGLEDGDNYSNLRFTTKRVLKNYFSEEIATACLYHPFEEVRNTLYKNNPDCITQFEGEPNAIREGENYIPTGAIITPLEIKTTLLMSLQEYWNMQTALRTERGFIRTFNADGLPLKGYIKSGEWVADESGETDPEHFWGKFECLLEEKYEPFYMSIFAEGNTFIINDEIQPSGFTFSIEHGYLKIFDSSGKLLHVPVPYDRVSINNSGAPSSPEELGIWLSQFDID